MTFFTMRCRRGGAAQVVPLWYYCPVGEGCRGGRTIVMPRYLVQCAKVQAKVQHILRHKGHLVQAFKHHVLLLWLKVA